jgi:hypothetical protein
LQPVYLFVLSGFIWVAAERKILSALGYEGNGGRKNRNTGQLGR